MWHCAFLSLLLIICVWMLSYGIFKNDLNHKTAIQVNIVENTDDNDDLINNNSTDLFVKGKVKQHVPKFMLDLYEKSKSVKKHELNHLTPDIVRSVVPSHAETISPLIRKDSTNDHHMLIFNLPNTNIDESFVRAELRVLTLIEIKAKVALGIERQIKISLYNETTKELLILEEKHIYHSENTWISFNVSNAVCTLLSSENDKVLKLVLTIKTFVPFIDNKIGVFKLSLMPINEDLEHDYPILLLFYVSSKTNNLTNHSNTIPPVNQNDSQESIRRKRYIEDDYEEETNKIWDDDGLSKAAARKIKKMRNTCRRKPLYIDFAEIQYDSWIVQPSGYEAYQCAGKCFYPVAEHLSPTKHAIVQALLHSVSPTRAPRSCCVPTKLDSISVLYVDTQGVLTYRYGYKDMVVTECGCR